MNDESFHIQFFKEAIGKIQRMRYVDPTSKKPLSKQPPSLNNLILTIRGFLNLWTKLKELGFKHLKTKHINQDPLEKFFSGIRAFGTNRKPTCYQFIANFKTLVINNLTKSRPEGANCIDDESSFILSWQNYFGPIDGDIDVTNCSSSLINVPQNVPKIQNCGTDPIPEKGTVSTATNLIIKKMFKKLPSIKSCDDCNLLMNKLIFTPSISTRRSTSQLENIHIDLKSILRRVFSPICHETEIVKTLTQYFQTEIRTDIFTCTIHKVETVDLFLKLCIEQYITSTTMFLIGILKGKIILDLDSRPNSNFLVIKACAKFNSSLKSQNTFSTLQNTISIGQNNSCSKKQGRKSKVAKK